MFALYANPMFMLAGGLAAFLATALAGPRGWALAGCAIWGPLFADATIHHHGLAARAIDGISLAVCLWVLWRNRTGRARRVARALGYKALALLAAVRVAAPIPA